MTTAAQQFRVSLVQTALQWHDPAANRREFAARIAALKGLTDLIVLPEMFTTGFTMQPGKLAEEPHGDTHRWLEAQARELDAAIAGSIIVAVDGERRNRMLCVLPDGTSAHYDKRHLFRMGGEHRVFTCGAAHTVVSWRGARIGLQVCYDLRFPVWSRRRADFDYELLVYAANWPNVRAYAWTQLLRARAIENQAYVIGVNRIGRDGHGVPHLGDSAALDYFGKPLAELGDGDSVETVSLDLAALRAFRAKFPAHLDADSFEIQS